MKTERIQLAITNAKQLATIWANDANDTNWSDFVQSLNQLVQTTIEDTPPKIELVEVEVKVEVPLIKEVIKSVPYTQEVPVFRSE